MDKNRKATQEDNLPYYTQGQQNSLLKAVEQLLHERLEPFTKRYLDCSEACRYLNISKSTLYKKNLAKAIPYFKAGGKVYYERSHLDTYITKNGIESMEQLNNRVKKYMRD